MSTEKEIIIIGITGKLRMLIAEIVASNTSKKNFPLKSFNDKNEYIIMVTAKFSKKDIKNRDKVISSILNPPRIIFLHYFI